MVESRIMMLCFVCFVTISLLQVVKYKIFFTLNFKEIKIEDDSTVERYECWAHKIGDITEEWERSAKHGFNVQVIRRSTLPTVIPNSTVIVEKDLDDTFSITCNISIPDRPLDVRPKSIHWLKNNVTKQSIYADWGRFQTNLKPLVFSSVTPEDGGNYTCTLATLLRLARPYTITGGPYIIKTNSATFTSKNLDDNEITGYKGKSANFSCSAVGFPLTVKWEMKLGDGKIWKDVVSHKNGTRYQIIAKQDYEAPNLKINDIQYSDRGLYRCCIVPRNGTGQCQKFVLRVGDPNMSIKPSSKSASNPTSNPTSKGTGHAHGICDHFLIIMCITYFCSFLTI